MTSAHIRMLERAARTVGDAWPRDDIERAAFLDFVRDQIRQSSAPETLLFVRHDPVGVKWTVGPLSNPREIDLPLDGAQLARDAIHAFNTGRDFVSPVTPQGFYTSVRRTLANRLRAVCPALAVEVANIRMNGRYVPTPDSPQIITERACRRPLTVT